MTNFVQFTAAQASRIGKAVQAFEATGRNKGKPRTHGLSQAVRFPARITAVGGSFPQWSYTVQRVINKNTSLSGVLKWTTDGVNLTAENTMETPGTPNYTYGNGVLITSSSGQVNGTACLIVAIGVGAVVDVTVHADQSGNRVNRFAQANSAQ